MRTTAPVQPLSATHRSKLPPSRRPGTHRPTPTPPPPPLPQTEPSCRSPTHPLPCQLTMLVEPRRPRVPELPRAMAEIPAPRASGASTFTGGGTSGASVPRPLRSPHEPRKQERRSIAAAAGVGVTLCAALCAAHAASFRRSRPRAVSTQPRAPASWPPFERLLADATGAKIRNFAKTPVCAFALCPPVALTGAALAKLEYGFRHGR